MRREFRPTPALLGLGAVAVAVVVIGGLLATGAIGGPKGGAATVTQSGEPTVASISGEPGATSLIDPAMTPLTGEGDPPPVGEVTEGVTGKLELGDPIELVRQTVPTSGGTITIDRPGDPLDGLRLDVPRGAYAEDAEFVISERPITSSTFGSLVTPITPLIVVEGPEDLAAGAIRVVIPAKIAEGSFAAAFTYDEATGDLEGLTLADEDAGGLTVLTRHFSAIFAGDIAFDGLPESIDTAFRPGADDWQFPNMGSYLGSGQCAGQSVSAMWYYVEHHLKLRTPHLFGTFDNNGSPAKTPMLWQDDSLAYRLAAVVQQDLNWKAWSEFMFGGQSLPAADELQFRTLRAEMAVSGRPQYIAARDEANRTGHALIAYMVTADTIYVADPNYPGQLRTIHWDAATGKLGPYSSGESAAAVAAGDGTLYTRFMVVPQSILLDESKMAARWAEFEDEKIGDGQFPAYHIEAQETDSQGRKQWVTVSDGYRTSASPPYFRVVFDNPGVDGWVYWYDVERLLGASNGTVTEQWGEEEGEFTLGFFVEGRAQNGGAPGYVDFTHRTIVRLPPRSLAPGTAWHLVKSETRIYDGRRDNGEYWQQAEMSGNAAAGSGILTASHPEVGSSTARFTWTEPPGTLAPGTTFEFTVKGNQKLTLLPGTSCDTNAVTEATVGAVFTNVDGSPFGGSFPFVVLYCGHGKTDKSDPESGEATYASTGKVPVPSRGDVPGGGSLVLKVSIDNTIFVATRVYTYEWGG